MGIILAVAGQLMYCFSYKVGNKWFIMVSRLVQGAACYQALAKTYVATTTGMKNRLFYFMIFGTSALSVYVLGNLLAFLTDVIAKDWKDEIFNRYTAPAWLMVIFYVIYGVLFALFWREPTDKELGHYQENDVESQQLISKNDVSQKSTNDNSFTEDKIAIYFVYATAFLFSIVWSSWEVFTAVYCHDNFMWSTDITALYLTIIFSAVTIGLVITIPVVKKKKIADRTLVLIPLFLELLFIICLYNYEIESRVGRVVLYTIGSLGLAYLGGRFFVLIFFCWIQYVI